jgi:hypothetical protein
MLRGENRPGGTTTLYFRDGRYHRTSVLAAPERTQFTAAMAAAALGVTASAPANNRNTAASVRAAFGL